MIPTPAKYLWLGLLFAVGAAPLARAEVQRASYRSGPRTLVIEALKDDLLHFELSEKGWSVTASGSIYSTPMVAEQSFGGPKVFLRTASGFETGELRVTVEPDSLCASVTDLVRGRNLLRACGDQLASEEKQLFIDPRGMSNVYGVGNFFWDPSSADGDWAGRLWNRVGHGNTRNGFHGGAPSMSQFPIIYALGQGYDGFALFYDTPYGVTWDFRDPSGWKARAWGDQLRWYVMSGPTLKDLRQDYLNLVGKPQLPPRSALGLWVSEFGYDNWRELREDLASLRADGFPVDGFALDLQWFGGSFRDPGNARMGTLSFGSAFSDPASEIRRLREEGVQLMAIEESYVDDRLPEHAWMRGQDPRDLERCGLARKTPDRCDPVVLTEGNHPMWWGRGGMIDWTNEPGAAAWHRFKRHELAKMGITAHWTDLGEPEMYDPAAYYHGLDGLDGKNRHGDIHNLYSFFWLKSIDRGYRDPWNERELRQALGLSAAPRHFIMSRAGAPGLQRFGAGLWSGDIGRNMGSLRAHINTQMHMTMAGVDYYNSDVGGFARTGGEGIEPGHDENELYTQWFADSALGEIPLRPHGWAYGPDEMRLGPNQRGHAASNLANLRLRYRLIPYLYSLAHRASLFGEAIFPPLAVVFQDDPGARAKGSVKMMGESLLFGIVAGFGQKERTVYLPKGKWFDFYTGEVYIGEGRESRPIPLYRDRPEGNSLLTLPLFARAGAIIPTQYVDARTLNSAGRRSDGGSRSELVLKVFAGGGASSFTLFEDDGETVAYRDGRVRETLIRQVPVSDRAHRVVVEAAQGDYSGAVKQRDVVVEWVSDRSIDRVMVNGQAVPQCRDPALFSSADPRCWIRAGNLTQVRSGRGDVGETRVFEFLTLKSQKIH